MPAPPGDVPNCPPVDCSTAAEGLRRWRAVGPEWQLIGYLWVCYALNQADRQVVYTLFPVLQKEFGYSDAMLGLMGGLFVWVYSLCGPVAGILGDRMSKTRLIVWSLMAWSMLTVLSGVSPNGWFLLACRALLGVSEALFFPAACALVAVAHGPRTRSRAMAVFSTSYLLGMVVGGSLSGFMAERFHWRVSFWLLGSIGLLFVLPLLRFFRRMPVEFKRCEVFKRARPGGFLLLLQIPTFRVLTVYAAVASFGLELVNSWLPTFLFDRFHIGLARAGFEASMYPQIGDALGLLIGGWGGDWFGKQVRAARFWALLVVFLALAPCVFLLGMSTTLGVARAAVLGFGLFFGLRSANMVPATVEVVPAAQWASAVGLLVLLGGIVAGFGPLLGGVLWQMMGMGRLLEFTSVMYLAAGALMLYAILRYVDRDMTQAEMPGRDG